MTGDILRFSAWLLLRRLVCAWRVLRGDVVLRLECKADPEINAVVRAGLPAQREVDAGRRESVSAGRGCGCGGVVVNRDPEIDGAAVVGADMNDEMINQEIAEATESAVETAVARGVAPEDLTPGDCITVLQVLHEKNCFEREAGEPTMVWKLPAGVAMPARVLEICLPFVLIETVRGKTRLVDVRRFRLARVSERFAERVRAQFADEREKAKAEEAAQRSEGVATA